jgi:hypothetical protein
LTEVFRCAQDDRQFATALDCTEPLTHATRVPATGGKLANLGKSKRHAIPKQSVARDEPIFCLAREHLPRRGHMATAFPSEKKTLNEYEVTYINGEVMEIEAWTPELAQAIAEEEAEMNGQANLSVVSVKLLASQTTEL